MMTPAGPKPSQSSAIESCGLFDRPEVMSAVLRFHCKGYTVSKIIKAVAEKYPEIELNRADPYAIVREAARRGWLQFRPPQNLALAEELRRTNPWLNSVNVVRTTVSRDVALHAADALVRLLKCYRRADDRQEVHVGFAGGHSVRALARAFADLLSKPEQGLPETIVFHSMAAGFDPTDPTTDPNTFFTYFLNEPVLQIKPKFMGLNAPSIVKDGDIRRLRELADIKAAFAGMNKIDIIVTSGTEWSDPHSALLKRMQTSTASMEVLAKAGCIGDILWRPLADDGPIEQPTEIRALTLIELSQLTGFIRRGKHVLLMLGPCGGCSQPKGRLLGSILDQRNPLITDLVVDTRTVVQLEKLKIDRAARRA